MFFILSKIFWTVVMPLNAIALLALAGLAVSWKWARAGRLLLTVDQQAAEQGFQGIALAMKLIKGEPAPEILLIDTRLVTAESVK